MQLFRSHYSIEMNDKMQNTENEKLLIQFLLKEELRSTYSEKLKEKYGIEKGKKFESNSGFKVWKIAAALLVLFGSAFLIKRSLSLTINQYAGNLIEESNVPGNPAVMRKDLSLVDSFRQIANENFIKMEYQEAIKNYELIALNDTLNGMDHFYLGVSYLKNNPISSEKALKHLSDPTIPSTLKEEQNWFLSLSYIVSGQEQKASLLLSQMIKEGHYKDKEIKKLLKKMNP